MAAGVLARCRRKRLSRKEAKRAKEYTSLTTWSGLVRLDREALMPMTNISEAKAQLSALIERVLAGEEIIIAKAGKPVARLTKFDRP